MGAYKVCIVQQMITYRHNLELKKNLVSRQELDPSVYLILVWFLDIQEILKTEWCKKIKTKNKKWPLNKNKNG